jgi:uncharacterized protein
MPHPGGTSTADAATKYPLLAPFYQHAAEGALALPSCRGCRRPHWYPKACCPHCQGRDLVWAAVQPHARLFSWTVVEHAFAPEYKEHVPFTVALVVPLDAQDIRLAVNLLECADSTLLIGTLLKASFRPALLGGYLVPWFSPAQSFG